DLELEKLVNYLPKHGKVLDAGSGSGEPVSKYLVDAGLEVIGVDLSDTMLKMARKNVPEATFLKQDLLNLEFDEESFDGIISVFTLFHIPKKDHFSVFLKFYGLLKSGGILLINTGTHDSEGFSQFFGVPMFWSNYAPEKTLSFVKDAGFSIIFEDVLARGGEIQYWIFARK
ncbi:MAG: class I SAM-dependent methyltransferase, partial [Promethearchaeia archaeon]